MSPSFQIARLRPLATAALLAVTATAPALAAAQNVYSTQQVPVPSAYQQPAYDEGDPANANLALVDRSPEPPPPLPVYVQPPAPADGYLWVPGYWSLNRYGFFWVPGAWVLAPYQGALWTPGYWGFSNGVYLWNPGYWGPHVGFYGGINYGFGYTGLGYVGGYWKRDRFYYNRSVTNVNITRVTNVYNRNIVVNNVDNRRVSYHGGPQGVRRNADPRELAARNDRHAGPTDAQRAYVRDAGGNRAQFYDHNKGKPPQAYVDHPNNGKPGRDARPQGNNPSAPPGAPLVDDRGRDGRPGPRPRDQAAQQDRLPQDRLPQDRQQQVRDQQARDQLRNDQQRQQQAREQQSRDQQLRDRQQNDAQAQQQLRQQQMRDQEARQQQQRDQQNQQDLRERRQQDQQARQQRERDDQARQMARDRQEHEQQARQNRQQQQRDQQAQQVRQQQQQQQQQQRQQRDQQQARQQQQRDQQAQQARQQQQQQQQQQREQQQSRQQQQRDQPRGNNGRGGPDGG